MYISGHGGLDAVVERDFSGVATGSKSGSSLPWVCRYNRSTQSLVMTPRAGRVALKCPELILAHMTSKGAIGPLTTRQGDRTFEPWPAWQGQNRARRSAMLLRNGLLRGCYSRLKYVGT